MRDGTLSSYRSGLLMAALGMAAAVPATVCAECVMSTPAVESMGAAIALIETGSGDQISIPVRVANDMHERAGGFQDICPAVIEETVILFAFPDEVETWFHMRNVYAPLDIAFIAQDGTVLAIRRMEAEPPGAPVRSRLYGPEVPFRYAMEARAGFFSTHGIAAGSARFRGYR